MSREMLLLTVMGLVVLAAAAGVCGWLLAWVRDPGRPTTPGWTPGELTTLPTLGLRPTGLHRVEGPRAYDLVAADTGYRPRHGFDAVPPSIAVPLALMTPVERARELVRQLGEAGWWPFADQPDRRVRLRLRAWAITHRHGLPNLLGTFQLQGVLP